VQPVTKSSVLDAYSRYNQIPMATTDMNKIAFITSDDNYFYKVMPFGLKNTGATYHRLMDKVFNHLMGMCVEVYVDDMVFKSPSHLQHAQDLSTVFSALRQYNLRLNPEKCVFGVDNEKFLGFMLTQREIETNPEKCKAIIEMCNPTNVKEVQRLVGRLTSYPYFFQNWPNKPDPLSSSSKNSQSSLGMMIVKKFSKTSKIPLHPHPILHKPDIHLSLLLYITAIDYTVSTALVQEFVGIQHLVYFVSRTL